MKVVIEGVDCQVPERYPSYPPESKAAIERRVRFLKERCGELLLTVYVWRVVTAGRKRPRVDGGYCTAHNTAGQRS